MLKLSKLFYTTAEDIVFHDKIEPPQDRRKALDDARVEIRSHLTAGIGAASLKVFGQTNLVRPRFRTQGSWAYGTCVSPAFEPPQEMDWDYGVYLPLEVWEKNGPPDKMAKLYFDLVDNLLAELCRTKGWQLQTGKETCSRVKIASWGHIDIPLYAAPEHEFNTILEKATLNSQRVANSSFAMDSADLDPIPEQQWDELKSIVMATRSGQWKPSDPEKVSRWFRVQKSFHGDQLARICRFFKSWRDHQWKSGGPTSILLMIAICQKFKQQSGRDDLCVQQMAKELSAALLGEIREFGIDERAEDFNRLSADERNEVSTRLANLANELEVSLNNNGQGKQAAIQCLQNHFGFRIPNAPQLIDEVSKYEIVTAITPKRVPQPVVGSTSAG